MAYVPPEDNPLNPFRNAPLLTREIKDHVTAQQLDAVAKAEELRGRAVEAVQEMARLLPRLNLAMGDDLEVPVFPAARAQNLELPELSSKSFGNISPMTRDRFTAKAVDPLERIEIDELELDFDKINIPEAPEPRPDPVFPDAPEFRRIDLPEKPVQTKPAPPVINELKIPEFVFEALPPFNDKNPQFKETPIAAVVDWQMKEYEPILMDEEVAVIRRMWAGGTGLPPVVERAMWERAANREDIAISRDVSAATIEFSARGYTLPPGALVNRIDDVRLQGALRKQEQSRDILIKIADTQIENLRFACTQALAAENVMVGIWSQTMQMSLDHAKAQLDASMALLNANIAIYNAKQGARQQSAAIWRLNLEKRSSEIERMRLELDAELGKGQINEQRVKLFSEMMRALSLEVEQYKAEMRGAQLESEMDRLELEKYKASIQAEAEKIAADKLRYEVFESRVKGETAKASLLESQARSYSAYVSGRGTVAEIGIKNQQAQLQEQEHSLRAFIANLDADKAYLQSQLAVVTANAEMHKTNTARFSAQAQAEVAIAEMGQRAWEAQVRNAVALYEVEMRKLIADMEQMIRSASLQVEGAKAIGQAYSTLAAGAMAGVSFSSSLGASAGTSASGTSSVTESITRG